MKTLAFILAAGIALGCEAPVALVPGAKVVPLWPASALRNCDQKEVVTPTQGQPDRIQKVVNIHNPSIELHLASSNKARDKANGTAIVLAAAVATPNSTSERKALTSRRGSTGSAFPRSSFATDCSPTIPLSTRWPTRSGRFA